MKKKTKKKHKKIENLGQKLFVWFLLLVMIGSFLAGLLVYLVY